MIYYKDMTFCPENINNKCKDKDDCFRALTKSIRKDAEKWWGKKNPPFSIYTQKPKCFKLKKE